MVSSAEEELDAGCARLLELVEPLLSPSTSSSPKFDAKALRAEGFKVAKAWGAAPQRAQHAPLVWQLSCVLWLAGTQDATPTEQKDHLHSIAR